MSIGCAPCTRATQPGEQERAGRWWWESDTHKECLLHPPIEVAGAPEPAEVPARQGAGDECDRVLPGRPGSPRAALRRARRHRARRGESRRPSRRPAQPSCTSAARFSPVTWWVRTSRSMRATIRTASAARRAEADRERVLLNVVDVTPQCDWIAPALVRRGPLQIAISTSGESPFLARALRERIETMIGEEWGPFTALMGRMRRRLRRAGVSGDAQQRAYRRLLRSRGARTASRRRRGRRRRAGADDRAERARHRRHGADGGGRPRRSGSGGPGPADHGRARCARRRRRRLPRRAGRARGPAAVRPAGTPRRRRQTLGSPVGDAGRHQRGDDRRRSRRGPGGAPERRRPVPLRPGWRGGRRRCNGPGSRSG